MASSVRAVESDGLTRRFQQRTVVDDVNLQVPANCVYGFLGLNGAGKTTTIRMLLGLIRPDAGGVRVFGSPFSREQLARVGSLVESPSLYSHLTGRENLEVARRLIGAARASIDRALAIVRLESDAPRLVREYSLGMKQRLGLALALLSSPDLLILDEPTNGLDPAGIHEMRHLLRGLPREHGVTVFLSSHLLSEVEQIADAVSIIHEGRLVFQGALSELQSRQSCRLRIGVTRDGEAAALLRQHGVATSAGEDGRLTVEGHSPDAARINRMLVEGGHEVSHLCLERESLEDVFFSLTGGRMQ